MYMLITIHCYADETTFISKLTLGYAVAIVFKSKGFPRRCSGHFESELDR